MDVEQQDPQIQALQEMWEQVKDMVEELFLQCGEAYQSEKSEIGLQRVCHLKVARMVAEQMEGDLMAETEATLETVNLLLNQWQGAIQGLEKVQEMETLHFKMQSVLGSHYMVMEEERMTGEALFGKGVKDMSMQELKAELEAGEDQLAEEQLAEDDIEEQFDMDDLGDMDDDNMMEESYMDIDESDYTQLIDKERFSSIPDTSQEKTKVGDDYLCSLDCVYDEGKRRVACGSGDDCSYLVDGQSVMQQKQHSDTVQIVRLSKDGKLFATGAMEDTLCVYDAATGELKQKIYGCTEEIRSIDWHNKGKSVVLSGGADGSVWLHNGLTGQFMGTFHGHQKPITHAQFTRDGKKVLSTSEDGVLRVWDPLSSQCVHKITGHQFHTVDIVCMDQHPSQQIVLTGGMDYFACLSNWQTGKVLGQTNTLDQPIFQSCFSQAQEHFYLGTSDGQVPVYDITKMIVKTSIKLDGPITKMVPWQHLLLASTAQGFIYLVDPRQPKDVVLQMESCPSIIHDFVLDSQRGSVLVAAEDGYLREYKMGL